MPLDPEAGLSIFEIARAVDRLRRNYPTFCEVSIQTAEKMRWIERSGDEASSVGEEMLDTTRHPSRIRSGVGTMRSLSLV